MNNLIVAKTSFNELEMKAKLECGFENFEIHLNNDFHKIPVKELYDIADKLHSTLPNIVAVHTPLDVSIETFGVDSVDLIRLMDIPVMRKAFELSCLFANILGELYGHDILVITHMSESFSEAGRRDVLPKVSKYMNTLLATYQSINIGIENVTPTEKDIFGGRKFRNGILLDPVKLVEYLNITSTPQSRTRFTNVLDTCHMITTIRMYEAILIPTCTLEEVIRKYSKTCNYVHLANVEEFGTKPKQHRTGFIGEEAYLSELITMLNDSMKSPAFCLEIREDNYQNPINAIHAKDFIMKG